jgi:hypothetical protein
VGLGYHQLVFSTAFSKVMGRFEPFVSAFYMLPKAADDSPFAQYPLGTGGFGGPQQQAGAAAGVELLVFEDAPHRQRVTLALHGWMELRFFGLARSEMWEPLSGRSSCATDAASCRPGIDRDLTGDGRPEPFPGITRSPSYGLFGGEAGVNAYIGKHLRFRVLGGISREQDRFLSDGRSGNERLDLPGRRFRVEDAQAWQVLVEGGVLF